MFEKLKDYFVMVFAIILLDFRPRDVTMGLLSTSSELFGSSDLYSVLGVGRDASSGQIKKGYHKISLQVHPDRVADSEREESTRKFQCLGAVYAVLADQERRGLYDQTGEVEDEVDPLQDKDKDWEEYWRFLFPKISVKVWFIFFQRLY